MPDAPSSRGYTGGFSAQVGFLGGRGGLGGGAGGRANAPGRGLRPEGASRGPGHWQGTPFVGVPLRLRQAQESKGAAAQFDRGLGGAAPVISDRRQIEPPNPKPPNPPPHRHPRPRPQLMLKDLRLAMELASSTRTPAPMAMNVSQL